MRLKLYFDLENERISIQYRKFLLSFIKFSLSNYDKEEFDKLYNNENVIKPYTFAVFFYGPKFLEEEIILKDKKLELNISIEDYNIAVKLYNSFNHQKQKEFLIPNNKMILRNISLIQEKEIKEDTIEVKFVSPLIVRDRNQLKRTDMYYSFGNEKFKSTLKINIREQLKISNLPEDIINTFDISPINAKKIIVKFYEKKIEASVGTFELKGDKKLLDYLYKSGMGSKHSSGFGMFNII